MKNRLWLVGISCLLLGGCYRPATKVLVLQLPDTQGDIVELEALKQVLLGEQDRLRDGLTLYQDIRVDPEHAALKVTYYQKYLADMNVIYKLKALGYRVNGLPGDPGKRAAFRKQLKLP